jgi:hypothetical protein
MERDECVGAWTRDARGAEDEGRGGARRARWGGRQKDRALVVRRGIHRMECDARGREKWQQLGGAGQEAGRRRGKRRQLAAGGKDGCGVGANAGTGWDPSRETANGAGLEWGI